MTRLARCSCKPCCIDAGKWHQVEAANVNSWCNGPIWMASVIKACQATFVATILHIVNTGNCSKLVCFDMALMETKYTSIHRTPKDSVSGSVFLIAFYKAECRERTVGTTMKWRNTNIPYTQFDHIHNTLQVTSIHHHRSFHTHQLER